MSDSSLSGEEHKRRKMSLSVTNSKEVRDELIHSTVCSAVLQTAADTDVSMHEDNEDDVDVDSDEIKYERRSRASSSIDIVGKHIQQTVAAVGAAVAAPVLMTASEVVTGKSMDESFSQSMEGDVNTGTYTRVHLRVKVQSRLGETVHCSGSSFIMGQFNPNESMMLVTTPDEYPYWSTMKPLILPQGVPHCYMYALFSGGVFSSWEPLETERTLTPEGREMTVVEEFGVYDAEMQLVRTEEARDRWIVYERKHVEERITDSDSIDPDSASTGKDCAMNTSISPDKGHGRTSSGGWNMHRSNTQSRQSRYKRFTSQSFRANKAATLFLISYHLPVKVKKHEGKWIASWDPNSLIARSEKTIAESMKVRWVGFVTRSVGQEYGEFTDDDKVEITQILEKMDCLPLFISRQLASNHYQGYCKSKLWPMFHNIDILDVYSAVWDQGEVIEWKEEQHNGTWWAAYQEVNQLLAARVYEASSSQDTLWVHDYHLLLFPSYIAEFCKKNGLKRRSMVFFLHVPFPTSEIFRELSHGPQLLEGVLKVDVVGFHSFDHARHFLNACKRFLGLSYQSRRGGNLGVEYRGRNVVITISHVGIEIAAIRRALNDPKVQEASRKLREKHAGKILIAGMDLCQRLSGIPLKLLAFEQFFSMCPTWKDRVVLVQRCHLSRSRLGDQQHSSIEIRELVNRITNQYGEGVIDYEESYSAFGLLDRVALWLACDILMVTSVREGLNLRPLEYVFCKGEKQQSRAGVVILSEFSACCCVLNGGLRINPWNIAEVVNALDHALTMSDEERMGRRARDLPYIMSQPASSWTRQVLGVLQEATENEEDQEYTDMEYTDMEIGRSHVLRIGERSDFKQLNIKRVLQTYASSRRRLFFLDYGGTIIARENISMYVKRDFTAVTGRAPSSRMLEALKRLTMDPRNTVFIISGVSQRNLMGALGQMDGLGLVAQNGLLMSWPVRDNVSSREWQHDNVLFDWETVREVADPIFKVYSSRTNGSVLRYSDQSIAWNFRSTDPEWGLMQANSLHSDLEEVLRDLPVTIVRKKGFLEIVPEGFSKGVIVRKILEKDAVLNCGHPDFLFCIGDDTTDESMFRSIYDYYAERSEESLHDGNATLRAAGGRSASMEATMLMKDDALRHIFTCTVGKKPSHAHLYVNDVDDVENLLYALATSLNSG